MFRVSINALCKDKDLATVLRSVSGLLYNAEISTVPVANAMPGRNGGIDAEGHGDIVGVLKAHLKKHKVKSWTAKDAKAFQLSVGRSGDGYSGLLKKAQEAGVLKKTGTGTKSGYKVMEAALG